MNCIMNIIELSIT